MRERVTQWVRFVGWQRLAASVAGLTVSLGVGAWLFLPGQPPVDASVPMVQTSGVMFGGGAAVASLPRVRVHVTGAVHHPGVYELRPGDRVIDALVAAGGATSTADLESINLAQTILDTEQIFIPRRGTRPAVRKPAPRLRPAPVTTTLPASPVTPPAAGTTLPGTVPTVAPPVVSTSAPPVIATVNINTANAAQLDTLPGVGPTTARAILEYRRSKGPFRKPEDLMNVPGIGPAKFARVKPYVTV